MKKLALLILAVAIPAFAQTADSTTIPQETVRWLAPSAVAPGTVPTYVLMLQPSGKLSMVVLGPGLTVDTSTNPPTLRINTVTFPTEKTIVVRVSDPPPATVTIPDPTYDPTTLTYYRNGILQVTPGDYTISGTIITPIGRNVLVAGDIAQVRYRLR